MQLLKLKAVKYNKIQVCPLMQFLIGNNICEITYAEIVVCIFLCIVAIQRTTRQWKNTKDLYFQYKIRRILGGNNYGVILNAINVCNSNRCIKFFFFAAS